MEKDNKTEAAILRKKAEDLLKLEPSETDSKFSPAEMRELIREFAVCQIGLESENKELLLAKEQAETERERTYREIFDASNDTLFVQDIVTGAILDVNKTGLKMYGYSDKQELLKCSIENISASEEGYNEEKIKEMNQKAIDSDYNLFEWRAKKKDGNVFWVQVSLKKVKIGGKNRILTSVHDITEQKSAEGILQDIIEKNPMSIQIVDTEGFTLKVNPAHTALFGSVPPPDFSIFNDFQLKQQGFGELIERIKNGEIVHFPDAYYNAHDLNPELPDVPVWILTVVFPLFDNYGKPERFVFMHKNITDRKLGEQELIIAKEHAEECDRLKSAFLANMSHEIRTPMNGILGFTDLLKGHNLTGEEQNKYIGIIEKSGARLLNIINDIIDISKIESGQMEVSITETNINGQIEYIYAFFKSEAEAKGMQINFQNTLPLNEAFIKTDREKFYSILTNLVKNAIKYTMSGTVEFGYNLKNNYLEFFVKDTGIGIAKDRLKAIFERFVQADIADRQALQGSGLGLAIAKAYIEMLGGTIWVESEEGIGSMFYFTIPYIPSRQVH